jgi:hypothetical protein
MPPVFTAVLPVLYILILTKIVSVCTDVL